jgi:hypothetical protein
VTVAREDIELRWPRETLRTEVAYLVNQQPHDEEWFERCVLVLEDAFVDTAPRDQFVAAYRGATPGAWMAPDIAVRSKLDPGQAFLVALLRRADRLREAGVRSPYFSQRRAGATGTALPLPAAVRAFGRVVGDLDRRGYFERAFGKDCVDDPREVEPGDVIASELGVAGLWPVPLQRLADDQNLFLDMTEVLHDLVAAPRTRWMHGYGACGYHHGDFSTALGQEIYRWSVNRILDRTSLRLRLADEGEDLGRLVAVTDDARTDLAHRMAGRSDEATGDEVRHALAVFRGRNAGVQEKRSACIALAGVLERRRTLLKEHLPKKDEGMLFRLANEFGIRHQNDQQRTDYDPAFLDWVFWFYLATIELSDRLIDRGVGSG